MVSQIRLTPMDLLQVPRGCFGEVRGILVPFCFVPQPDMGCLRQEVENQLSDSDWFVDNTWFLSPRMW